GTLTALQLVQGVKTSLTPALTPAQLPIVIGTMLADLVDALQAPGLTALLGGLGSFVITGSGDDVVSGGLLTRFPTGGGNDRLFAGPIDPTALTNALAAKGLGPAAISHLLDTAGGVFAGGKGSDTYY